MEEKKQTEMRADAPKTTTYQLVEVLTPDYRKVWQLNLTTPNENLIDEINEVLNRNFNKEK